MRKRRILFMLLLALLPVVGWAQQKNYDAQHVSIKQTTGDSIQYDISSAASFRPVIKDGKIVWSFSNWQEIEGSLNHETELKERFTIENVENIDFRSFEYDEREARNALIDLYNALDGDSWPEEYKTNWCSDKPIGEWRGVNSIHPNFKPWVVDLDVSLNLESLSPRSIPECISKLGPTKFLMLNWNNFTGTIPEFIGWNYCLSDLQLAGNKLTGPLPKSFNNLAKMPHFWNLDLSLNSFEGELPENLIVPLMDIIPGTNLRLKNNYFSGKVPDNIKNHSNFRDFWPLLLIQEGGGVDLSDVDIPAPIFSFKDINGETIDLAETYKKNVFTLLYKWGYWCPFSELFNQKLIPACLGYKDKGLEVIGLHIGLDMEKEEAELKEYVNNHSIPWDNSLFSDWNYENGLAKNATSAIMWTTTTPELLLVDQKGNVVFSSMMDEDGNDMTGTLYRDKLFKYLEEQLGTVDYNFYTSTDYSQDGIVSTMQTASEGQGVDLVFVGEGFTDQDIAAGTFDQRMYEAMNQFFAYEPFTSLKERFNVYTVKAVSPNAEFLGTVQHAFDEDVAKVLEYASKVPTLIPNRPMRVVVVYNNASGERSYCNMMEDDSFVCFCMDGVSTVLNHEAGGHGIGKLQDEYVEAGNESLSLPEENKTYLENVWTALGWGANVDWRSAPTEVKWAKFISDSRYADEKIGIYEGSYLYQYGAYRPTENSMMRYNDTPFNAPSREEIYKRVMKESEGDGWIYDYENFVAFDAAGHTQFVGSLGNVGGTRSVGVEEQKHSILTAPPVLLKGTWRDVLKKNQK